MPRPTWLSQLFDNLLSKGTADPAALAQALATSPELLAAIQQGLAKKPEVISKPGPSWGQLVAREVIAAIQTASA